MKFTGFGRNVAVLAATSLFVAACSKDPEPVADTTPPPEPTEVKEEPVMTPAPVDPITAAITEARNRGYLTGDEMETILGSDRVLFAYDSSELDGEAMTFLRAAARLLGEFDNAKIQIQGHCDERGTRDYNLALGDRRAVAVRDYLVSLGVDSGQLDTISYGKERPVAVGGDDRSHAANRRGMLVLQ